MSRNIYIGIIVFSCFSSTNPCLRFLLNCFLWERKGFYESSFGNWIDFRDIMNVSLNILAKKLKSQKTETLLCRWKSNDYNNINYFLSLGNPCTFLLVKEKTRKRTKKTNYAIQNNSKLAINDMWCYLLIACFHWKIGVFQQTVARVYCIIKHSVFLCCSIPSFGVSTVSKTLIV